jgi:broad specificity phosphatase PhoE
VNKKLLLLRHGESEGNKLKIIQGKYDQYGLSKKGISQCKKASTKIKSYNPNLIITSPLKRTIESSIVIKNELSSNIRIITDSLLEEISFGKLEGITKKDRDLYYNEEFKLLNKNNYDYSIFNGEPLILVRDRAKKFINKLEMIKDDNILVITHGGFMRELIYCFGFSNFNDYQFQNGSLFYIANGVLKKII